MQFTHQTILDKLQELFAIMPPCDWRANYSLTHDEGSNLYTIYGRTGCAYAELDAEGAYLQLQTFIDHQCGYNIKQEKQLKSCAYFTHADDRLRLDITSSQPTNFQDMRNIESTIRDVFVSRFKQSSYVIAHLILDDVISCLLERGYSIADVRRVFNTAVDHRDDSIVRQDSDI